MIAFLKSLRFWRYRALYLTLVAEHAAAGYDVQQSHARATLAFAELKRLQGVLAPYGARILSGQAEGTTGPIQLPPLEFEMARAHMHVTSRMSSMLEAEMLAEGSRMNYGWRGRPILRRA